MLGKGSVIGIISLVVVLSAMIGFERRANDRLRADNAQLALQVTNDSAALDSTRLVSATNRKVAAALGDSLRLYQRQVVQVAQTADAVDKALKLERLGKYALTASVDSLKQVVAAQSATTVDTARSGATILHAQFALREPPYTVAAHIDVPVPPAADTAKMELRILLDPIPVVARLSCAPANDHGIRSASIEATVPAWAAVRFTDVQQSPDLCASPALANVPVHRHVRPAFVAGFGKVTTGDGRLRWGAFVGGGIALGG